MNGLCRYLFPRLYAAFSLAVLCTLLTLPVAAAPGLKLAADADNVSTVQNLNIDRTNITFDPVLTALGEAVITWRATIENNPSGASFSIMRTAFTGGNNTALADNIRIIVEDGAGQLSFVPNSKFISGTPLSSVATVHDNLGTVTGSGECRFRIKLILDAKSNSGAGALSTGLIITGALNP